MRHACCVTNDSTTSYYAVRYANLIIFFIVSSDAAKYAVRALEDPVLSSAGGETWPFVGNERMVRVVVLVVAERFNVFQVLRDDNYAALLQVDSISFGAVALPTIIPTCSR